MDDLRRHLHRQSFDAHDAKDDQDGGGQDDDHGHLEEHILDQLVKQVYNPVGQLLSLDEERELHHFLVHDPVLVAFEPLLMVVGIVGFHDVLLGLVELKLAEVLHDFGDDEAVLLVFDFFSSIQRLEVCSAPGDVPVVIHPGALIFSENVNVVVDKFGLALLNQGGDHLADKIDEDAVFDVGDCVEGLIRVEYQIGRTLLFIKWEVFIKRTAWIDVHAKGAIKLERGSIILVELLQNWRTRCQSKATAVSENVNVAQSILVRKLLLCFEPGAADR